MIHGQRAAEAATMAARNSYSRLISYLAARTQDVAAAEDALADAFCAALETWPQKGVPRNPEAWLLVSANNRLNGRTRHEKVQNRANTTLRLIAEESKVALLSKTHFPDERLKLLFICAHPAINVAARTPLMLQTVLGLDAAKIASAFLVTPSAMSQRLVRAKAKIRAAKIPFQVPAPGDLPQRLEAVLEAIYAAFGTGWAETDGTDPRRPGLVEEALWLAQLVVDLLPAEPEAKGLLALMLYCEARRPARRGERGEYIALSEQNPQQWLHAMIASGEKLLAAALSEKKIGRFQLEAAIQSAHANWPGINPQKWDAIVRLYDKLVHIAPTIGAHIGRAAALGEANGLEAGLAALDTIDVALVENYQPYWAVKADLLTRLGHTSQAHLAYERAIGLCEEGAVRSFLQKRQAVLQK